MFYRVNAKYDRSDYDNPEYNHVEEEVYFPDREQIISYLVDLTGRMKYSADSEITIKPHCFAVHKYYKVNDIHGREVFSNET